MPHMCWELNWGSLQVQQVLNRAISPAQVLLLLLMTAPVFMWHTLLNITRAFYVDTDLNSTDYNFISQMPFSTLSQRFPTAN